MMCPGWILLSWLTLAGAALAEPRWVVVPSFGDPPYHGVLAGIRQVASEVRLDSQALPPTREALERRVFSTVFD